MRQELTSQHMRSHASEMTLPAHLPTDKQDLDLRLQRIAFCDAFMSALPDSGLETRPMMDEGHARFPLVFSYIFFVKY